MSVPHVLRVAALLGAAAVVGACGAPEASPAAPTTEPPTAQASPAPTPEPSATATGLDDVPVPDEPDAEGTTFATLRVPRWGDDYAMPISEGITDHVLDTLGMGRFPYTQMPGEEGNFAVAGHRTDGSRPLADIDALEHGDELFVDTALGTYTYELTDTEIVTPDQVRVVQENPQEGTDDPVGRLLTLVACHPWDSSEFRYITYAELTDFTPAE